MKIAHVIASQYKALSIEELRQEAKLTIQAASPQGLDSITDFFGTGSYHIFSDFSVLYLQAGYTGFGHNVPPACIVYADGKETIYCKGPGIVSFTPADPLTTEAEDFQPDANRFNQPVFTVDAGGNIVDVE